MPGNALASQCTSSPERQARHSPHVLSGGTIPLSPSRPFVPAGPTASTQPAFSWPIVYGSCTFDFSAHWPSRMCRSVRHTPAPPILTITSNGPGRSGLPDPVPSGPHDHVDRAGRLRLVDLVQLEVLVVADHLDGSHLRHGVCSFSREVRG